MHCARAHYKKTRGITMKLWHKILAACIVAAVVVVGLLPIIASQSLVQRYAMDTVNKRIRGKLTFGRMNVGWYSGLDIHELELKDPENRKVASCDRLQIASSLFSLLGLTSSTTEITCKSPQLILIEEDNGHYSIERAIHAPKDEQTPTEHTSSASAIPSTTAKKEAISPFFVNCAVEQGTVTVTKKNKDDIRVRELTAKISISGFKKASVTASADIQCDKENKTPPIRISVQGTATNFWNQNGLNLEGSEIELETHITELPMNVLELFGVPKETTEKAAALLGGPAATHATGKIVSLKEGNIELALQAPRFKSQMATSIKDGVMRLQKPMTAECSLTQDAGKVLFKGVNSLFASGVQSEQPITIWIDNKGFQVPVKSFSKDKICIQNGKIDLGKLRIQSGGALDAFLGIFNLRTSAPYTLCWFTPIYLQMQHGNLICQRCDIMLENTLHVATWGNVNIPQDRVDMVVGVFGDGLARALRLEGLSPSYVMQLPVRGTMATASIDKTSTAAKLASLRMSGSQNTTQSLIGDILGLATTVTSPDAPVPPPTTSPLPWEI